MFVVAFWRPGRMSANSTRPYLPAINTRLMLTQAGLGGVAVIASFRANRPLHLFLAEAISRAAHLDHLAPRHVTAPQTGRASPSVMPAILSGLQSPP